MPVTTGARRARNPRPAAVLLVAAVLAALFTLVLAPAGPAHAASYRYWGYYQLQDGKWAFASKGPSEITPKDSSVEGWRFAISGAGSDVRNPRATVSFTDICGDTEAQTGKKRVGIVIDYGRVADGATGAKPPAPAAKCAVVDQAAHGDEVLSSVADVRAQKGLVCSVDAYPAQGCGDEVKNVTAAAKKPDTPVTLEVSGSAASTPAPSAANTPAPSAADTPAPSASASAGAVSSGSPSATDDAQASAAGNHPDRSDQDTGTGAGTWVGIAVVIAAILAVVVVALRRRKQV